MANGTIHKLGTLYTNNTKRAKPTNPWSSGGSSNGAPAAGNIFKYNSGGAGNIEIRNTDADDAYKLQWVEVNDGDKKLLICDRNILTDISWDDLNAQGLVNGKEITIDGQRYKVRLLSGGTNYRSGFDSYSGGTPTTNEWDRIITNESSFSGLPKPVSTDLDSSLNSTDVNSAHNKIWNWFYCYSWCQEVYYGNSSYRVFRGYISARFFNSGNSYSRSYGCGWRPALEVLNSAPTISINNEDLGNQLNSISKTYNIIDEDGDTFTLTEKLNGTPIRILENQVSGTEYTLDLTQQWDSLSYGNHTIEIIATDSNSLSSTVTITFNKIKEITKPIPTTSNLKAFIDHIGNIDKDIDYLRCKLADNLTKKGVEVLPTDKMSTLIDKVSNIELDKKWAKGSLQNFSIKSSSFSPKVVSINLSFIPSQIILNVSSINIYNPNTYFSHSAQNFSVNSNSANSSTKFTQVSCANEESLAIVYKADLYIELVDAKSFRIMVRNANGHEVNISGITWEAFE